MKQRLLIVDDEPDMLDFVERVFRAEYQVVRASSAEEALAVLERQSIAVIITDQKMPHTTGVQLLEQLYGGDPGLVKILLSGFTEVPEIERAMQRCGIHNYVVKPVDSGALRAAVAEAIARHRAERTLNDSAIGRTRFDH